MSDHSLPDDVRRWPSDPYALLGVAFDVSLRDLKKAYTRLIRLYRPEDAPEQFRKIRDAYEMIESYAKFKDAGLPFFSPPAPIESEASSTLPPEPQPERPPPEEKTEPAPLPHPQSFYTANPNERRDNELQHLWEQACRGEEEEVYRRLRQLNHQSPLDTDILLRLYWLLNVLPSLDPIRHPCDWLAESLRVGGLVAHSRELYRRHVFHYPDEALSDRYSRLLEFPAPAAHLIPFVEWRWQAASRLERADIIVSDLRMLETRMLKEDEDSWVRLLFVAADELAWSEDDRLTRSFHQCRSDLEKLEHVQARHGEAFTRLDFLKELAEEWKRMLAFSRPSSKHSESWQQLLHIIPLTWTRTLAERRALVLRFMEKWLDWPTTALEFLDLVRDLAPRLLSQLLQTLDVVSFSLPYRPINPPSEEVIEARSRYFLLLVQTDDWGVFRHKLVDFCCREFLAPERMADVLEKRSRDAHPVDLFTRLRDDMPVRCLCLAHRLFWA